MDVLRTPEARFADIHDWPFEPNYLDVGGLRVAYVDEGPRDAAPVLLLHGEPTWSYLYRKVLAPLLDAGHRIVAPDLIGFGRSDKPVEMSAHSYAAHVRWTGDFVRGLDLSDVTLVCHDWGGLIGLRVLTEETDRFARVVATNTGLPTGDHPLPEEWWRFRRFTEAADRLPIGFLVNSGCHTPLPEDVIAAYDAPFPDETYKAAARAFPLLVPTAPDDPETQANRAAWAALTQWDKPFLCAFSDGDPVTRDVGRQFEKFVPGTAGLDHPTISGAGHFLQEDAGEQLADAIVDFLQQT